MTSKLKMLVAASTVAVMMSTGSAHAAGTLQGTDVINNVSVAYQVGGVSQTAATGSNTFKVDRKVIFTVTEPGNAAFPVVPGQTNAYTTFLVTNTSNDTLDFNLALAQLANGTNNTAHSLSDAFNINAPTTPGTGSPAMYLDVDPDGAGPLLPDGIYTPGTDTVVTSLNDLAPDTSARVFIVGSIPTTVTNGQAAGVTLTATALNSNGSAITAATDSTANTAAVETIFADTGRDGIESAGDDYNVSAANLTVTKYSRVVSDGVSASNPKAIPGAVVEYCIAVSNAASAATATNVTISDNLTSVAGTTYQASFTPATDGTVVNAGTSTCTPGAGTGSYNSGTDTVSGTLTNIAAGETRTLVFRVTID
jgi:hypothetical protein